MAHFRPLAVAVPAWAAAGKDEATAAVFRTALARTPGRAAAAEGLEG